MGGERAVDEVSLEVLNSRKSGALHFNSHPVRIAAIAAANVIATPIDSILPRGCGSCAVLLNNRERPPI